MEPTKLYGSTLIKAKDVLDFLTDQPSSVSLTDVTNAVDFTKSTVRKILDTLIVMNWVHEDEQGFRISASMIRYGEAARKQFNIVEFITPLLRQLSEQVNETVNFVILDGDKVTLIKKFESLHSVALKSVIGGQMDLYSTSVGKAILASFDDEKVNSYLDQTELIAKTPTTITNPEELRAEIAQIKKLGFAREHGENEADITCVGASLIINEQIIGALSISTPSYRINAGTEAVFAEALLATKTAALKRLGTL